MEELDRIDELVAALKDITLKKAELIDEYAYAKKAELITEKHGAYFILTKQKGRYGYYFLIKQGGKMEIDGPPERIRKWCKRKEILQEQILLER